MDVVKRYQYIEEDGTVNKFEHTTRICHCMCYSGCYPDELSSHDPDEEGCGEDLQIESRAAKYLITDMINMLMESGQIKEIDFEVN